MLAISRSPFPQREKSEVSTLALQSKRAFKRSQNPEITHLTIPKYQSSENESDTDSNRKDDEGGQDIADYGNRLLSSDCVAIMTLRYYLTDVHRLSRAHRDRSANFEERPVELSGMVYRAVVFR